MAPSVSSMRAPGAHNSNDAFAIAASSAAPIAMRTSATIIRSCASLSSAAHGGIAGRSSTAVPTGHAAPFGTRWFVLPRKRFSAFRKVWIHSPAIHGSASPLACTNDRRYNQSGTVPARMPVCCSRLFSARSRAPRMPACSMLAEIGRRDVAANACACPAPCFRPAAPRPSVLPDAENAARCCRRRHLCPLARCASRRRLSRIRSAANRSARWV